MKALKKGLSLLLAAVMVMALSVVSFAEGTTYTISAGEKDTHTYKVYQIMTGDFDASGNITNAKWGAQAASTYKTGDAVDASVLKTISELTGSDSTKAAALKAYANMTSDAAATVTKDSAATVVPGYYLISDTSMDLQGKDDAYTLYLVKVVKENITITPKTGTPTLEKKVKDTNDSVSNSTTDWQDSADYDIGDEIPYKLTATMGDISNYDKYYVKFTDSMTHLTYKDDSAVVKVGDTTLTSEQYTLRWDASTKVLTVAITDVKTYGASTGTKVTVEYTATLDSDATIGSTGNPNEAYLEYSNNPNNAGSGETGKTPTDKNIVFTYKVTVDKTDANNKALAGAKFTLYKFDAAKNVYVAISEVEATANGEKFTAAWTGIDDGKYKLVETGVPSGYQKANDVEFEVSATHDTLSDNPALTQLNAGDKLTGEVSTGVLSTTVVNTTVSSLPSTGGMGTTIFYVMGTILVLGAGVVLVSKKRMGKAN